MPRSWRLVSPGRLDPHAGPLVEEGRAEGPQEGWGSETMNAEFVPQD